MSLLLLYEPLYEPSEEYMMWIPWKPIQNSLAKVNLRPRQWNLRHILLVQSRLDRSEMDTAVTEFNGNLKKKKENRN